MTSNLHYLGELRCTLIHLATGQEVITDAPTDNRGKGEAFSPTDLTATSLGACMLTVMGIKAADLGVDLTGTKAEVLKTMASDPRRITGIQIDVHFPNATLMEKVRHILEHTARTCPVAHSLHPDIVQDIRFHWPDSPLV